MFTGVLHKGVWIAAIALIGAVSHGIAQDLAPLHQVQAVVDGVRSPQHAYEADLVLRALPGVVLTRTDHNTRNLLMHVPADLPISAAVLNEALATLGMSVRCYQRGPIGQGPFRHLDPRDCGLTPTVR